MLFNHSDNVFVAEGSAYSIQNYNVLLFVIFSSIDCISLLFGSLSGKCNLRSSLAISSSQAFPELQANSGRFFCLGYGFYFQFLIRNEENHFRECVFG